MIHHPTTDLMLLLMLAHNTRRLDLDVGSLNSMALVGLCSLSDTQPYLTKLSALHLRSSDPRGGIYLGEA